ncbi:MAG: hypothetical protein QOJ92_2669 [Frankiales bacterium]|nr:hypothetical protein [Frankiales bacterium]
MTTASSPWAPLTIDARSEHALPSTRATVVALSLGLGAAYVLPEGVPGAGIVVLGAAAAIALRWLHGSSLRGWQAVHALLAMALLACLAWRDAPWVVALDLLGSFALGSLALAPSQTWAGIIRSAILPAPAAAASAAWFSRGVSRLARRRSPSHHLVRGLALTGVLLAIFLPLLTSADRQFADLMDTLLPGLPDLGLLPARAVLFVFASCGVAGGIRVMQSGPSELVLPPARHALRRRSEWALPLGVLTALLGLFVLTQLREITHGRAHVLATDGVTYASYAHAGFFQLLAVTALVLAVVAAASRWAPRSARPWLGALCLLALAVDASALLRLHLYADAYGLTRLRITASAVSLWLGVVIVLVLAAAVLKGRWLPNSVVLSAAVGLLALTAYNPDARIARSQLARPAGPDLVYLAGLSADAVDVIGALPAADRDCLLRPMRTLGHGSWTEANLARHHAAVTAKRLLADATVRDCPAYSLPD